MKRIPILRGCWILLLTLLTLSTQAATGLALVHGTGSQTNAYDDYWTSDMVESLRQGLPNGNNLLVVNCDFEQYMWQSGAAGCLATQLYNFITTNNIDDLVVITHSNGGNVIRWILSNPTENYRHPTIIDSIRWVNALAPSSAGTPLADAVMSGNTFERALGWLLGYASDAVNMQREGYMAQYNSTILFGTSGRPSLPVDFFTIVGTDVESSPFDSDSYCGGYSQSVGLETTQNWLDDCSDGFLECSSQSAAGSVWYYDYQFTDGEEPLNHNQSRRDCFGLDELLRDDI